MIHVCKPEHVEDMWDVLWPLLEKAVEGDPYVDEAVLKKQMIADEIKTLIATVDGKIKGVACIDYEEGVNKVAIIRFLGGKNMKLWGKEMNEAITKFAKFYECKYIIAFAREAWQRIWPDFRNTEKLIYMKEIL